MKILCRVLGHAFEDWFEWRVVYDVVTGAPLPYPLARYQGQQCSRCGERFPGMTCRPAYRVRA